jgi:hypothetical protein
MSDEMTGFEWAVALAATDAALKCAIIDTMMLTGTADPDKVCKLLRNQHRRAVNIAGPENAAATVIEQLRLELFGANDRRLPARRSQVRRARRRANRVRHIRGY